MGVDYAAQHTPPSSDLLLDKSLTVGRHKERKRVSGGGGQASAPLIIEKIMMGLSNTRHKGRFRTQSISDIIFVIFCNYFREVK